MIGAVGRKKSGLLWLFAVLAAGLAMGHGMAFADGHEQEGIESLMRQSQAFASIAERATPAVVFIRTEREVEVPRYPGGPFGSPWPFEDDLFERFFGPRPERRRPQQPERQEPERRRQHGQGSGFIISEDGLILTNHHVVGEATVVRVRLHDGREFKAETVGTDPKSDVALVKIEGNGFPTLPLGDSNDLQVGEWVMAIGNPFGLAGTVSVGVVSAKGRSAVGIADYEDFIQTDAAINPGNSGGPLLNLRGEAVGINTAIFSRTGGYMGIGFAIPMDLAGAIKQQLLERGEVTRGFLGVIIQEVTKDLADTFGLSKVTGVLVSEVIADSPAKEAGLEAGDIILEIDGRTAESVGDLRNQVSLKAPGTEVTLLILRDEERKEVKVTVGHLPSDAALAGVSKIAEQAGLKVQELTDELARQFGYRPGDGVVVSEVEPGSPAAEDGIRPGALITAVNRRPVSSVEEFNEAIERSAETRRVLLHVRQDGASRFVVLSLE